MRTRNLLAMAGVMAFAAASMLPAQTAPAGIAGRWSQASNGKELVLAPRIKLVPNVGVTAGTSLGGTVGYGAMSRTTIVTEAVVMPVVRSMTLAIAGDGRFQWTIVKRHAEERGCTITTTQNRQGRATRSGTKLSFAIASGTESFSTSCGRSGTTKLGASTEQYELSQPDRRLVLAQGPNRWAFDRAK